MLALFLGNTEKVTLDYYLQLNPMAPKLGEPCHQFPKSGFLKEDRLGRQGIWVNFIPSLRLLLGTDHSIILILSFI